jgi:phage tail-like protein
VRRSAIVPLLPENYQRAIQPQSPLSAVLDVMERLHAPSLAVLADLDEYFDARRAPDRFVPYLARWVDLGPLLDQLAQEAGSEFPSGNGRLRELVAAAAQLSKWRGTRRGLMTYLEVATGLRGFEIQERPDGRPFHLRVVVPVGGDVQKLLIERIVEQEKPIYTTHEVVYTPHPQASPPRES